MDNSAAPMWLSLRRPNNPTIRFRNRGDITGFGVNHAGSTIAIIAI
jgi:hypothetical protein